MKETAEVLNVAVGTVFNYLKKYGIETREQQTFKEHAALHMKERHEKRRNDLLTK